LCSGEHAGLQEVATQDIVVGQAVVGHVTGHTVGHAVGHGELHVEVTQLVH